MNVLESPMAPCPPANAFPTYPVAWYLFGEAHELAHHPLTRRLIGREIVAFRTASGQVAVLDARCAHMNANLGNGCVVGDTIRCPYHHWRYGADGRCVEIPSQTSIPAFARQRAYPSLERHGLVFFFNGPEPLFPLPFFDGCDPGDFMRARPFGMELNCPWWLVGANACDLQHFMGGHDRRLAGPPTVESATPFCRRARAPFAVAGTSWRDWLTRWFGGGEVELAIADWCGTFMFVTATFRRTRSYGMLTSIPIGRDRVLVRGVVFVRRSRSWAGRLVDPFHLRLRRYFIKEFLRPDAELARHGVHYQPDRLLPCDGELGRYFGWLAEVSTIAARNAPAWTEG
jgi:phenylpropionate dioxygenase-like ring-hydroxylating dioxygenase large terminal subunit